MGFNGIPSAILNWVDGNEHEAVSREYFPKVSPVNGREICRVARSRAADVQVAVAAAKRAQPEWSSKTVVARGDLLRAAALLMRDRAQDFAKVVSTETGKSVKDALGETNAAVEMGLFIAGEGRRFYGRTTTSAVANKAAITVRQPLGVAGLIIAANTPIANVAWKAFPALLCGNTAVLKASEDAPLSAWMFGKLLKEVGMPNGVFNVIQGFGKEAGAPLVESPVVDVISFTGSCEVGRSIQRVAGERLAKVCLELGGKNPLIVCDDADLGLAAQSVILSAFSNAGQRCAAGSRVIVFYSIYERFREQLIARTQKLKIGPADDDDFGPVINSEQLQNMLAAVNAAERDGAKVLTGGVRLAGEGYDGGFYMAPTLIEGAKPSDPISRTELFGPIACLYRVETFEEALTLANDSPFGLTASIHTKNVNRAMAFLSKVQAGVAVVNGPTYGSEPHMPFGGIKESGNGFREAGTEVLDVYSDWKTIYISFSPEAV
jgi:aldehyde dehydrogenase (NAD+)